MDQNTPPWPDSYETFLTTLLAQAITFWKRGLFWVPAGSGDSIPVTAYLSWFGIPVTVYLSWFRPGPAGPERPADRAFESIEKGGIADRPADPFRLAQALHPVLALFTGVVKCTVTGTSRWCGIDDATGRQAR